MKTLEWPVPLMELCDRDRRPRALAFAVEWEIKYVRELC